MNRSALTCTSIASLALLAAGAMISSRVTAGPLSPPSGAVSSTYKTLAEVEPRIAINATNTPGDNDSSPSLYKITQHGSYCLAVNVTGVSRRIGIEIVASGVTLDLAGSSLIGVPGSKRGIHVAGDECRVENNHCDNNDAGVFVAGHRSRVDGNSCMSNNTGFDVDGLDNLIIRNTASASGGANYSIVTGNSVAPRVGVVDSDGWTGIGNADHPWANLGY